MGKYLELEPPGPSLGVHRSYKDGRRFLICVPKREGAGGRVSLLYCVPQGSPGDGGMVQSRDKNGMRGFEGESISGEWNTGVRVC